MRVGMHVCACVHACVHVCVRAQRLTLAAAGRPGRRCRPGPWRWGSPPRCRHLTWPLAPRAGRLRVAGGGRVGLGAWWGGPPAGACACAPRLGSAEAEVTQRLLLQLGGCWLRGRCCRACGGGSTAAGPHRRPRSRPHGRAHGPRKHASSCSRPPRHRLASGLQGWGCCAALPPDGGMQGGVEAPPAWTRPALHAQPRSAPPCTTPTHQTGRAA